MLVLSRKVGQTIEVELEGEIVLFSIERIDSYRVRVGVTARNGVNIRRGELSLRPTPSGLTPAELHELDERSRQRQRQAGAAVQ